MFLDQGDPHGVQQDGPAAQVPDNGEPGHPGLPSLQAPGRGQLRHMLQVRHKQKNAAINQCLVL